GQHHSRDGRDRERRPGPLGRDASRIEEAPPTMATAAPSANGRVIQITGPVVDIEFPAGHLPAIFNAVEIIREGHLPRVWELQQRPGKSWGRGVAMTTPDGLARGTEVRVTGAPIAVPVGDVTLGRVFDVLGRAIDGKGEVHAEQALPI